MKRTRILSLYQMRLQMLNNKHVAFEANNRCRAIGAMWDKCEGIPTSMLNINKQ